MVNIYITFKILKMIYYGKDMALYSLIYYGKDMALYSLMGSFRIA
jgi:hypothetical protein